MPSQVQIAAEYKPRSWALPAHRSRAHVKVVKVHRRGGKGWFSLYEGMAAYAKALGTKPDSELVPGFHAWSVAPSFPQARQSENELEAFLPEWARPPATQFDQSRGHSRQDHIFNLRGSQFRREGMWEVKSAHEPEALQTVGLDFLHVQESQDIPEAAFNKLMPTLDSPGRMSLAVFEGIAPDDPNHWFERLFKKAEDDTTGYYEAFTVPYTENPDLSPEVKAQIEDRLNYMLEREWSRMYLVKTPEGSGNFLGNVDACITQAPLLENPELDHKYVMGLDLAKKVDFTVLIVMDACHRRLVWQRRIGRMDWNVQEEAIAYAAGQFGVRRIRMDSTGVGDPLYDKLRFMGLPVEPFLFTNESKYQILTGLAVAIEKRHIAYPAVSMMLRELKALRAEKLPSGKSRVSAPDGEHDDYPMALALAFSICDMPEIDMSRWMNVTPSRYAPRIDFLVPGGVIMDTKPSGWREAMRAKRAEARVKELEALGFEL